ncbi:MAG: hypothetical protein R3B46_04410 [Phycisphaerales bacterium]
MRGIAGALRDEARSISWCVAAKGGKELGVVRSASAKGKKKK